MWCFIKTNWTYFVALGTVMAYLFEKLYTLWKDKRKKQQAYNRVFSAIIKLYYSYLKHKRLYSETAPVNLPGDIYTHLVKHLSSFNQDLDEFKDAILKESDIIPEISFQTYSLFEVVDSIRVIDRISNSGDNNFGTMSDETSLVVKRAQFSALDEILIAFFSDSMNEVRQHTSVRKDFIKKLESLNSSKHINELNAQYRGVLKKYFESLVRQGIISKEQLDAAINNMMTN